MQAILEEASDETLVVDGEDRRLMVVRRISTVPKIKEDDWLKANIFQTRVECCDRVYNLIINSRSRRMLSHRTWWTN